MEDSVKDNLDKWLMRGKDVVIVFGIIAAIWGWGITTLKDTAFSNVKRLERLETALAYIAQDIKDIKQILQHRSEVVFKEE
jgi:hypothetical protein